MGTYSFWSDALICGWNFDSIESVKENYDSRKGRGEWDKKISEFKDNYEENVGKVRTETNVKLNLGGENDKSKIIFSDKPNGVFDFSLASQLLFRVQEFYSEDLKKEEPYLYQDYDLPSGVVPNYFIQKDFLGDKLVLFCISSVTGKRYNCETRQKGLTKLLENNPNLPLKKNGNMIIPEKPTKGVVFSSKTKKPYIKYLKRGGKVRYVEIYSLFYYKFTANSFGKSMRHLPVVLVLEYLEKMGTMCKFYVTRFVKQSLTTNNRSPILSENPKELDRTTGITLPMYEGVKMIGRNNFTQKLIVQPICVKEYGEPMNEGLVFGVSGVDRSVYNETYEGMSARELINNNSGVLGDPDWSEERYQEGFERFRQKFLEYSQKGVWKAKEVTAQGLILYHDKFLTTFWDDIIDEFRRAIRSKYVNYQRDFSNSVGWSSEAFLIGYRPETINFFELWIKITANTIKHKLDIFNSNNLRKTYQQVFKELQDVIDEFELLIKNETNDNLKFFFEKKFLQFKQEYRINKPKIYCTNRINEMTFYAEKGLFPTPQEEIDKRERQADRLREELLKM